MSGLTANGETDVYNQNAAANSKSAIIVWCIVGWAYAALTWRVLWLPGALIFLPGIFIASIVSATFFIPIWLIASRSAREWELHRRKRWGVLVFVTVLKIGGVCAWVLAPIGYVLLLRLFLD